MKPVRLSTFPLSKPFNQLDPRSSFSEVVFRLVVGFYTDSPSVVGTASILCGNLLITAKHVIDNLIRSKSSQQSDSQNGAINHDFVAIQILPGSEYCIWDIVGATADPLTDILLLHLGNSPSASNPDIKLKWKQFMVNPFSPRIGERVAAIGYRKSTVKVSKMLNGSSITDIDDELIISVGQVMEIFEWKRDDVMLPFPCYQVNARFDGGMSGGAVIDETGCLCGIICSNISDSHLTGEPVSYVSTLWPLFRLTISADRGDKYPRGVPYPVIELTRGKQIVVPEAQRLEDWLSKHISKSGQNSEIKEIG